MRAFFLLLSLYFFTVSGNGWFFSNVWNRIKHTTSDFETAGINTLLSDLGFDTSDNCGFTRSDALVCIARFIDINHNEVIDRNEFYRARRLYIPPRARAFAWVAEHLGFARFSDVMKGCDVDHDGKLTLRDWEHGSKHCLPHARDLCLLKNSCEIAKANIENMGAHRRF
jgi:hypothetical protein